MGARQRESSAPSHLQPRVTSLLEVRDLWVSFGHSSNPAAAAVVRGISFQVDSQGQRLGIVGESGAGKSMTALAIMRVSPYRAQVSGQILLDGVDLLTLSGPEMEKVRGRRVSMVYQNPFTSLNPLRRAGDQITEALRVHSMLGKRAARDRAIELLNEVGIARAAERFSDYPHEFSGGMVQRVMIAMAMSTEPEILIADEVTSALDVTTQAHILELIERLAQAHKTAVIFITHDLSVAARVCTDIQVMYSGRIVERAPAERFYREPVHPYSEALLAAICALDADVAVPLAVIPGQAPSPSELPSGCTFHPRCPYAEDICIAEAPPTVIVEAQAGRLSECHFALERATAHRRRLEAANRSREARPW